MNKNGVMGTKNGQKGHIGSMSSGRQTTHKHLVNENKDVCGREILLVFAIFY